uniref:Uncharacterized protein n=1 Tax=Loxodonta africana TaxID=9785 RepID=G3U0F5_LOXAF
IEYEAIQPETFYYSCLNENINGVPMCIKKKYKKKRNVRRNRGAPQICKQSNKK